MTWVCIIHPLQTIFLNARFRILFKRSTCRSQREISLRGRERLPLLHHLKQAFLAHDDAYVHLMKVDNYIQCMCLCFLNQVQWRRFHASICIRAGHTCSLCLLEAWIWVACAIRRCPRDLQPCHDECSLYMSGMDKEFSEEDKSKPQ
jgi:hypothetical protein